jgi:hypothetical protein
VRPLPIPIGRQTNWCATGKGNKHMWFVLRQQQGDKVRAWGFPELTCSLDHRTAD